MLRSYLILWMAISFSYSPIQDFLIFPVTNCYESFSDPKLIFKLSLYDPSGPDYLFAMFQSHIHYLNENNRYMKWNKKFHFRRINGSCEVSNIIFTTNGLEILKMFVIVKFYLSTLSKQIAHFHYTFENGFKNDNYTLIDLSGHFGMSTEIIDSKNQPLQIVVSDLKQVEYYLMSIKNKNDNLCILTENNRRVVIYADYGSFMASGYIIGITVEVEYDKNNIEKYEFNAYYCNKGEYRSDLSTVFITDGYPDITLKAIYIEFDDNNIKSLKKVPFYINKILRYIFDKNLIFQKKINMIFLINNTEIIDCPDGTNRKIYKSKDETIYYLKEQAELEIRPKVIQERYTIHPPWEMC